MRTRAERRYFKRKKVQDRWNLAKSMYPNWYHNNRDLFVEAIKRGKKGVIFRCDCGYCIGGWYKKKKESIIKLKEGINEYLNHDTWEEITDEMEGVWAYNDEFFSKYSAYDANAFNSQYY